MSDTLSATPELLVLRRPDNTSDARWAHMQTTAHKVVTGHYPWCNRHMEPLPDGSRGWCSFEDTTLGACVVLHDSRSDGQLGIEVRSDVRIDDMPLGDAISLGYLLVSVAELGQAYAPVVKS